ncbi:MAG: S-layer homology domain-containing protein [Aminipila sp.]
MTKTLESSMITVTNNKNWGSDTVEVRGLEAGDIVRVYDTRNDYIGSVTATGYTETVYINQLGTQAGSIYVSVEEPEGLESDRVEVSYAGEPVTKTLESSMITVTNNKNWGSDTVEVRGLEAGDIVRVFDTRNNYIGSVAATGAVATVDICLLGTQAGSIYVSVEEQDGFESKRIEVTYAGEPVTKTLESSMITVTNNKNWGSDTVEVRGLEAGDIVRVFDTRNDYMGSVTATGAVATVDICQLGTQAGSIYVSVEEPEGLESDRVEVSYAGEPVTKTLESSMITVTNNKNWGSDTVEVRGLEAGDIVRVYDTRNDYIGSVTATGYTETVYINQLGTQAGSIYVSVEEPEGLESDRVEVSYAGEPVTKTLESSMITVTNNKNWGSDTVEVRGLEAGDIVRVYDTRNDYIGSVTATGYTETVYINQLGTQAGSIYVSVEEPEGLESDRVEVSYAGEPVTKTLESSMITVTNNKNWGSDTVEVRGLEAGDIVRVFDTRNNYIGSVAATGAVATVDICLLGTQAGSIYVSVEEQDGFESKRIEVTYAGEPVTKTLESSMITVTNNKNWGSDTVEVRGLEAGDIVRVFDTRNDYMGSVTATGAVATVDICQLGTQAGSIYVSVEEPEGLESDRVEVSYAGEPVTKTLESSMITVTNNKNWGSDTVEVSGLEAGETVQVYDASNVYIGSVTAAGYTATVYIDQLGTQAGSVYVYVFDKNWKKSNTVEVSYAGEPVTKTLESSMITVTNNKNWGSDTVEVRGLEAGDIVRVYDTRNDYIGSVTATGYTETVYINQLGTQAGSIYVSVEEPEGLESDRVEVSYAGEPVTKTLESSMITVTNNKNWGSDTVEVRGLEAGDIVRVFDTRNNYIGSVAATGAVATVDICLLGTQAGSIYVSVEEQDGFESKRIEVTYAGEPVTKTLESSMITVTNNKNWGSDTVEVRGLEAGDIVRVYDNYNDSYCIGSVTATGYTATVDIGQLGTQAGSIYVSVEEADGLESEPVQVYYAGEPVSKTLDSSMIAVTNNKAWDSDTVVVGGVEAGDVVRVYDRNSRYIGSVTATGYTATVYINQLGTQAGSIYVSVEEAEGLESDRVEVSYAGEPVTKTLESSMITVTNNKNWGSDTVEVSGLEAGETVQVYDASNVYIGSVTAAGYTATVYIDQLGTQAGSVYVYVFDKNWKKSNTVEVSYAAEPVVSEGTNSNHSKHSQTTNSPVVVNGDNKTVKVQTAKPTLDTSTNIAKVEVNADRLNTAFSESDKNNVNSIVLEVPKVQAVKSYEIALPITELQKTINEKSFDIKTDFGTVTIPSNMINTSEVKNAVTASISISKVNSTELNGSAVSAIQDHPVVELNLLVDGKIIPWKNSETAVTVSIPYTPTVDELKNSECISVYYIDENGNTFSVPNGRYDNNTGCVVFSTSHFSKYAVRYTPKSFNDLGDCSWAKKEIEVLASKGVINGVTDKEFAPSSDITRADFLLLLVKTLGLKASFDSIFSDVQKEDYYYEAIGTAKSLGIVDGVGNGKFNPKGNISREEMTAMCARALELQGKINLSADLSQFDDESSISPYAVESMAKVVGLGLIKGEGETLNPSGNSTRAETAVLMYRMYNTIYK